MYSYSMEEVRRPGTLKQGEPARLGLTFAHEAHH